LIIDEKPKKRPDWMTEEYYLAVPKTLTVRELSVGKKALISASGYD